MAQLGARTIDAIRKMSRNRNPIAVVDSLSTARGGGSAGWARWVPPFAAALSLPLFEGNLLAFRHLEGADRVSGALGMFARVALVLTGVLSLRGYDLVVRGPDRGTLDLHPVPAVAYARARLARAAREALPTACTAFVFLLPVFDSPPLLLAGALLLGGSAAAGVCLGVGVNLAAPGLGTNPAMAGILDALRGANPRAQAALLWAPAGALFLGGLSVLGAMASLERALLGVDPGWAGAALPLVAVAIGARLAHTDADSLARLPAVLGEVEASWSAAETAEEGSAVYMDWVVPRLPAAWQRETLRVLRHGWRGERGWLSLGFVGAAMAAAAGFLDPQRPERAALVMLTAAAGVGLLGPRLRAREPGWLLLALPAPGRPLAHGVALWLWMQSIVLAGPIAMAVRNLPGAGEMLLRGELSALALAALGARLSTGGYVAVAVLVVAAGAFS